MLLEKKHKKKLKSLIHNFLKHLKFIHEIIKLLRENLGF